MAKNMKGKEHKYICLSDKNYVCQSNKYIGKDIYAEKTPHKVYTDLPVNIGDSVFLKCIDLAKKKDGIFKIGSFTIIGSFYKKHESEDYYYSKMTADTYGSDFDRPNNRLIEIGKTYTLIITQIITKKYNDRVTKTPIKMAFAKIIHESE